MSHGKRDTASADWENSRILFGPILQRFGHVLANGKTCGDSRPKRQHPGTFAPEAPSSLSRRIGNWLGIADVICHPSDYESHCFSINEAWLAGLPVVSCDYFVNRLFEERHGPLMWMVPVRPEPAMLAAAIVEAYSGREDPRVGHARDVAIREYSAAIMGRRWSDLVATLTRTS